MFERGELRQRMNLDCMSDTQIAKPQGMWSGSISRAEVNADCCECRLLLNSGVMVVYTAIERQFLTPLG